MEEKKKASPILIIILAILGAIMLGVLIWFGMRYVNKKDEPQPNAPEEVPTVEESSNHTTDDEPSEQTYYGEDCKALIKALDFSTGTQKFYCYAEWCAADEKDLLDIYNIYRPNNKGIVSGFSDYVLEVKDGEIFITDNGELAPAEKNYKLEGVKNPKSLRLHFSVEYGQIIYVLNQDNELYSYTKYYNWTNDNDPNNGKYLEPKLLYKNVKDFTVFEGHDYDNCLSIKEIVKNNEGQAILIILHTTDNKLLVGYGNNDFKEITLE